MTHQPQAIPESAARPSYNQRLFAGGLRTRRHLCRFVWVRRTLDALEIAPGRVLELGCYDGRAVEFLPKMPDRYLGLDADWEDALALAARRWAGNSALEFRKCREAAEMALDGETFDAALALETLEHVPPEQVQPYLTRIANALEPRGVLLVTLPNEKGIVFAAKHLMKIVYIGSLEPYNVREFFWQTIGRSENVARREHKGFDYARMVCRLREHFEVARIDGIPLSFLPPCLNFGIGVVCRVRGNAK